MGGKGSGTNPNSHFNGDPANLIPGRPPRFITEVMGVTGLKRSDVVDYLMLMVAMTPDQLQEIADSPTNMAMQIIIAKVLLKDIKESKLDGLKYVIERSIGKPTQDTNIDITVTQKQTITMPDGSKLEL